MRRLLTCAISMLLPLLIAACNSEPSTTALTGPLSPDKREDIGGGGGGGGGYTYVLVETDICNGGTVDASSEYTSWSGVWHAERAFDNRWWAVSFDWSNWSTDGSPAHPRPTGWISYEFAQPRLIGGYTIRANPNGMIDRSPRSWQFQGWDATSATWTTLHAVADTPAWTFIDNQVEKRQFEFANTTYFTKYRLNITANYGHPELLSIVEIEMFQLVLQ